MTVTIDLPMEIEARLLSEAQASGVPFGQLVKEVLIDHFEETEDRLVGESRLGDRQTPRPEGEDGGPRVPNRFGGSAPQTRD